MTGFEKRGNFAHIVILQYESNLARSYYIRPTQIITPQVTIVLYLPSSEVRSRACVDFTTSEAFFTADFSCVEKSRAEDYYGLTKCEHATSACESVRA